jgi:site-specific recombinase XerC
MTGRRKTPSPYPPRVYLKHGALRYVDPAGKWHTLKRGAEWDKAAATEYAKHLIEKPPRGTFAALAADYRESPAWDDLAPRTQADAKEEIRRLNLFFGRMDPAKILPEHVGTYKQERGKTARVRCNRELSRLRAILAYGLESGWVKFNAAQGIKPWKERPRKRLVSDEERAAFRDFAHQHGEGSRVCLAAMWLAYLTTQRRASVLAIRMDDLTDEGIRFEALKGGNQVLVRWTDQLRAAVDYAKAVRPVRRLSKYLLCNRKGKPYTDSGIKAMWNRLQVAWQRAGHERFTFHDSRAMGISKLKEQGRQAREISGHRNESTAERIYDRRRVRSGDAVE